MYGIEGLLAGRTLADRYLIEAVIGRGGMGAVYRARDERLGREVAVKVISAPTPDPEAHRRLRARFQREARAAAGLHHPNVVQVYDSGTDATLGLDFFVMELLRGEDLASRLSRKGPPATATALEIICQAARGLAAGHRAGLIHRDVKPGNLFLEPGDRLGDVQVKVLDFGIAELTAGDEQTMTHLTVVGRSPFSPAFASPEQMRGESGLSPASDVFSLGAVGFQLLTGKRAFQSADWRSALVELSSVLATDLPRVTELPAGARTALLRALAPEPALRFPHAGAFADAIEPFCNGRSARGASPAETEWEGSDHVIAASAWPEAAAHQQVLGGTRMEATLAAPLTFAQRRNHAIAAPDIDATAFAPVPFQVSAPPVAPQRDGWMRRAGRVTWNFAVTLVSFGLFAGSWLLAMTGAQDGELQRVFAGAAAGVVLTPLAIHRLTGRRGSYRFALFASIASSALAVYLTRSERLEVILAALLGAQLVASFVACRLTRRPRETPDDLDLL
jgi:tRNA A-37 threonylcarbamoyl transferase component Bud32